MKQEKADKENVQEKIGQIQIIQQNMHNIGLQRQQFQVQQAETESALSEIDKTEVAYKIIGNIMIKVSKPQLKSDLEEKRKMTEIRISTLEKQENKLREKAEELQKDILAELERQNDAKSESTRKLQ